MHFHSCSQHGSPLDRLCGLRQCGLLLCERCQPEHSQSADHRTALLLAPQTLSFFESFTGYTHYKMFDWLDCLRRHGFSALFKAGSEADSYWLAGQEEQLTAFGLQVLEDFQRLAQNNRQFVLNNRNSQSLFHPEFLRDLLSLATENWAASAQLILDNLARLAAEAYPQQQLSFAIRPQFLEPIEAYRAQLIGKIRRQVVLSSAGLSSAENALEEQSSEPAQAEQYELPYSIKQIESFEEIGERANRTRNTVCSIANDHYPSSSKQYELGRLRGEMEAIRSENSQLQEENRTLRVQNQQLSREREELLAKIQAFTIYNKENAVRVRELSCAPEGLRVRVVK